MGDIKSIDRCLRFACLLLDSDDVPAPGRRVSGVVVVVERDDDVGASASPEMEAGSGGVVRSRLGYRVVVSGGGG